MDQIVNFVPIVIQMVNAKATVHERVMVNVCVILGTQENFVINALLNITSPLETKKFYYAQHVIKHVMMVDVLQLDRMVCNLLVNTVLSISN